MRLLSVLLKIGLAIAFYGGMVLYFVGILITVSGAVLLGVGLATYGIYLLGGPLFMAASPLYFWILVGGVCTLLAGMGLIGIFSVAMDHH